MGILENVVDDYVRKKLQTMTEGEDKQNVIEAFSDKLCNDIRNEVLAGERERIYIEVEAEKTKTIEDVRINQQLKEWRLFISLTIVISFLVGLAVNETFKVLESQSVLSSGNVLMLLLGGIVLIAIFLFTDIRGIFKGGGK